ncbi:hypothetical protein L195_g058192, partial [Trifolium pratense]
MTRIKVQVHVDGTHMLLLLTLMATEVFSGENKEETHLRKISLKVHKVGVQMLGTGEIRIALSEHLDRGSNYTLLRRSRIFSSILNLLCSPSEKSCSKK